MYYPCSENKGADQLRGYREADLRLCFRICKMPVFSRRGSYYKSKYLANATEAFGGWTAGSTLAPRMILLFDDFPRLYNDKPDKKKLIDEAMRRKSQMSL